MKKLLFVPVLIAMFAVGTSFVSADTATSTKQAGFQRCVPVTHIDYPSGWYCPSEQARERQINLLMEWIRALTAQLEALLN